MNSRIFSLAVLILGGLLISCGGGDENRLQFEKRGKSIPVFNADSAVKFVEEQVSFGPRNPNSEGHRKAKDYLLNKLRSYAGNSAVYPQRFSFSGYEGEELDLTNIIVAFNLQSNDRIMLCAHWDSRPRADRDSADRQKPIIGADDGASGVAVLLELARIFRDNVPPLGIDIILFDGEDYGKEGDLSKYFLGSRYWADNPPVKGYSPRFGILLDMVGGKGARFPKEKYSMRFAPALVNEIWAIGEEKGWDNLFIDQIGSAINDDHVVINRKLGIPTINIIRHNPETGNSQFAPYWHTHKDNMDIISRETLKGVGTVITELVYNRIQSRQ